MPLLRTERTIGAKKAQPKPLTTRTPSNAAPVSYASIKTQDVALSGHIPALGNRRAIAQGGGARDSSSGPLSDANQGIGFLYNSASYDTKTDKNVITQTPKSRNGGDTFIWQRNVPRDTFDVMVQTFSGLSIRVRGDVNSVTVTSPDSNRRVQTSNQVTIRRDVDGETRLFISGKVASETLDQ
jgi:hypothetical protein